MEPVVRAAEARQRLARPPNIVAQVTYQRNLHVWSGYRGTVRFTTLQNVNWEGKSLSEWHFGVGHFFVDRDSVECGVSLIVHLWFHVMEAAAIVIPHLNTGMPLSIYEGTKVTGQGVILTICEDE